MKRVITINPVQIIGGKKVNKLIDIKQIKYVQKFIKITPFIVLVGKLFFRRNRFNIPEKKSNNANAILKEFINSSIERTKPKPKSNL